jgi:hypothetical protein
MSRLSRLLKSPVEKGTVKSNEPQTKCRKCGMRPAADPDGLCNQCRFDDVLTELVNKK